VTALKLVLASYGTRGDIEPCAAIGRELMRRGHDVRIAVPPDLVDFVESAGLAAVAYGLDTQTVQDAFRDFWTCFLHTFWRVGELIRLWRENWANVDRSWGEMSTTLSALAEGADLLLTGQAYQETAANVAEHHGIPLAALHYYPIRANGQLASSLLAPVVRAAMTAYEWLSWQLTKRLENTQRRKLELPKAASPSPRRFAKLGSLEIQAYDPACFPGLATEWSDRLRPLVGSLTMELPTEADDDVVSWIAAGTPPIYFGFGSFPVESPSETIKLISAACATLGERALVCSGGSDFTGAAHSDHLKVVSAVNHAAVFPACRAVVHHGGAGTTAAGLRAGVPTLILWTHTDQPIWGGAVKRLKVGSARRFSTTTCDSLVADLRRILGPGYLIQAREVATRMTKPTESVANAADLVENFARARRCG
jgi:UDP:flavonoid glycosyltransferase YjiC (YdhE family)